MDQPTTTGSRPAHGLSTPEFIALMSMASALIALSIDTMLPAFDQIRAAFDLAPDSTRVSLTITVFFLGIAVGQVFYGPFSDRYGRKPLMYVGLAIFALGALGSTLAPSLPLLLVSRLVWGIGAAGPRAVSLAIVRDVYVGDEMARLVSFITAVFLIVPILAPGLGELLLTVGDWRWTFGVSVVLSGVVALWMTRLRETLDPVNRLELRLDRVVGAASSVVTNRTAAAYTGALIMMYAAFLPWLGSSELIFTDIYGRGDQFALFFGGTAAVMALVILASTRAVRFAGAVRVAWWLSAALVVAAAGVLLVTIDADGVPAFWVFVVGATLIVSLQSATSPILNALALEPMGRVAGTASALIGAMVFAVGSVLASFVDRSIEGTITPLIVGFLVYGLGNLVFVRLARPASGDEHSPELATTQGVTDG